MRERRITNDEREVRSRFLTGLQASEPRKGVGRHLNEEMSKFLLIFAQFYEQFNPSIIHLMT